MQTHNIRGRFFIGLAAMALVFAGWCRAAWAVDGIILIDQNKALSGGATPGDTPGFPVTISQPGSYRLSSNLVVSDPAASAIVINNGVGGVSIDLNGFAIIGPGTGTGAGISGSNESFAVSVRNGTITAMGGNGIQLVLSGVTIENVTVFRNGGTGIFGSSLGTIRLNRVSKNGGAGMVVSNCTIVENLVSQNNGAGISANDSLIIQNALIVNAGYGVEAANSGFANNVFSSNNGGFTHPQFTGLRSMGPNLCDGSICP